MRIVSIALVAHWLGQERAVGFYHDYSGCVVFAVAVMLMVQVGIWLDRYDSSQAAERAPAPTARNPATHPTGKYVWLVCIAAPALLIAANLAMPQRLHLH